jgi:hypothetical protein
MAGERIRPRRRIVTSWSAIAWAARRFAGAVGSLIRRMAVPMSSAGERGAGQHWRAMRERPEQMIEQQPSQKCRLKLPCQWVEGDGFDVPFASRPANDPRALADTVLLLLSNALAKPDSSQVLNLSGHASDSRSKG